MNSADICLFLEGTYPYVSGGVSRWTHDLIRSQPHLTFYLVCILAPDSKPKFYYDLPKNVLGMDHVYLQKLPEGSYFFSHAQKKKLFEAIEVPLLNMQHKATLNELTSILHSLNELKGHLGAEVLLNSLEAWNMIQRMYRSTMGETSFLDYFWSWRGLLGGFYSIALANLPKASVYHTLCTGYAGLFLAKAFVESGRPCLTTEHGIYTNERRVEIISADWLADAKAQNLNVERSRFDRDLKDFWIDTFSGYSRLTYEASAKIITLYEGNKELQIEDKADPNKILIIPNGIDYATYSSLEKKENHPPTIALIGRIVPIKDVKNFIYAVSLLADKIPKLRVWILGPTDEDPSYYNECLELVKNNQLESIITFKGKVNIKEYIPEIDLVVLSSISEAQPLSLMEAGAAGIPCVTTNVGACSEFINGNRLERPRLGSAGLISQIANPGSLAENIFNLMTNKKLYNECSQTVKERVKKYYNEKKFHESYRHVYEELINQTKGN